MRISQCGSFRSAKPLTLEQQLAVLDECGIKMRPDLTIDDLLFSHNRDKYEKEPYDLLLQTFAGELNREPFVNYSDNIFLLKRHCISGNGSYAQLASKMSRLTGFTLPVADVKDSVSISEGRASLSFNLDGMQYRWTFNVYGDDLDKQFFTKFAELINLLGAGKRFFKLELKNQDLLIGCGRADQLRLLIEKTGLDFHLLTQ